MKCNIVFVTTITFGVLTQKYGIIYKHLLPISGLDVVQQKPC